MNMMDILGQMGQQQGPPPQEGPPPDQGGSREDRIRQALDMLRSLARDADDEQETLSWEKITTEVQKILAAQEKQDEDMMQGKMSPAALRRALG